MPRPLGFTAGAFSVTLKEGKNFHFITFDAPGSVSGIRDVRCFNEEIEALIVFLEAFLAEANPPRPEETQPQPPAIPDLWPPVIEVNELADAISRRVMHCIGESLECIGIEIVDTELSRTEAATQAGDSADDKVKDA